MITRRDEKPNQRLSNWRPCRVLVAVALYALFSAGPPALGQTFDSGSTGADGALNLTAPGTIVFDPVALGLDTDGDNVFQFTTITIAADVTVSIPATAVNGPVFWLALGNVQIDGIVDLNGEDGESQDIVQTVARIIAVPGAGGFSGGVGLTVDSDPTPGNGPGGGPTVFSGIFRQGAGAGHVVLGQSVIGVGGASYGNEFLVPLVGGSGGGGAGPGTFGVGGNGGAGGGALLIASSARIDIAGAIQANGGNGGFTSGINSVAGGGSGGAIHLLAPSVTIQGTLSATGGTQSFSSNTNGSVGRIRIEAFDSSLTGTVDPAPRVTAPFGIFLPSDPPPLLRVVSVGGVAVPSSPTGSFSMPDVTIDTAEPITVDIEASSIPLGTVVQLHLLSDSGPDQIVESTPLTGSVSSSTATATVTVPSGFSRGFVRATWAPPP